MKKRCKMKTNLTLIGMPGAGKSTVGIILAKNLGLSFLDTDILIQINQQKTLQEILDETGHMNLRAVEEQEILKINIDHHVISTGGSVAYSEKAMTHLKGLSTVIHLNAAFDVIKERINNFDTRGIAKAEAQTFEQLYRERQQLYRKYADLVIDTDGITQDDVSLQIQKALGEKE